MIFVVKWGKVLATCSVCSRQNAENTKICIYCGALLLRQTIIANGVLEIRLKNENRAIVQIDAPGIEGYILGRSDTKISYIPDIDLGAFNALENGVSRRHAVLINYQNGVHLLDLGSVNGTFINNERLSSDTPYPLCSGDELRLGSLDISILKIK